MAASFLGCLTGAGLLPAAQLRAGAHPSSLSCKEEASGCSFGGRAVDVIMLIMNDNGMTQLLSSKFKLGAQASVAAGPVGRQTGAETDWKMRRSGAELFPFSWSLCRSHAGARDNQTGREQHTSVLRTHGTLQDFTRGCNRRALDQGKTHSEGLNTSAGTNNQLAGFGYDAAGNMISNGSISY